MGVFVVTVLGLLAFSSAAVAAPLMAFMMEKNGEKQIMLSRADGTGVEAATTGRRWHLYPALDAAGKRLAWVEGNDETDLQVVVKDLSTGAVSPRTTTAGRHLHPRFSGDGKTLAVSGPYGARGVAQVALFDLQKTEAPAVIESEHASYFPVPSSDASFVVFQRTLAAGKKDIVLYRRDTKAITALTPADGESMAPALSFDDRKVAYTAKVDGNWDIYLLDRATNRRSRVTSVPQRDFAPRFRPDGSLVFASDRDGGTFQLFAIEASEMRAGTFRAHALVTGPADYYAPTVSGDVEVQQGLLPNLPEPARSSFGTARIGDRIYVSGGHQGREHTYPESSFLTNLEYFDIAGGRWHAAAPRPRAAHGYGLVAHAKRDGARVKHYLYAFGGFAFSAAHSPKWKSLAAIDRYDVEANRWETVAQLQVPRSSNVTAIIGDKVYLIAGWDSTPKKPKDAEGTFLRTIEVFDLTTETVTLSPHRLPDPLRRALSSVTVGDEIYLIGGLGQGASHFELLDQVTAYQPSTGQWRELPRLPFATFAPAAGVIGRDVYVFGGMFKTGPMEYQYVSHIFQLKSLAAQWEHTGRYLVDNKGFSMVVPLRAGELGILGGHSYDGAGDGPIRTFETYRR